MSDSDHVAIESPQRPLVEQRLHGLDWLRAGAALLVVMLHAGIAYLVVPMPGLIWATQDPIGSPAVDAATWWINGFVMPLFFVQSGLLARGLMKRKGHRRFVAHRTRRLLGPFALGCLLILPLDLYVWLLGWAAEGKIPLRKLRSLKIDGPLGDNLWGVSHLWFLQYLWVFCAVAWGACLVAEWRKSRGAGGNLQSAISPLALMLMSAAALWWEPEILIGFRHSWWPLPVNLVFYGPWFALGWFARSPVQAWHVVQDRGDQCDRSTTIASTRSLPFTASCGLRVVASLALFALLLPMIHRHVTAETSGSWRVIFIALFVLHAWLIVTGLFGTCLRWLNRRPPAVVKYLSEASFWVYLFHHPVVGLAQVAVSRSEWPVVAKFAVTLLCGLGLSLLTYQAFVRRTWLGQLLNGRRFDVIARPTDADLLPMPAPEPARLRKSA